MLFEVSHKDRKRYTKSTMKQMYCELESYRKVGAMLIKLTNPIILCCGLSVILRDLCGKHFLEDTLHFKLKFAYNIVSPNDKFYPFIRGLHG